MKNDEIFTICCIHVHVHVLGLAALLVALTKVVEDLQVILCYYGN